MEIHETELSGVLMIEPTVHRDARGHFLELYRASIQERVPAIEGPFVQDNLSFSTAGVLRGLHYQIRPRAQGKLVGVVSGAVYDVAVDIRESSETYGGWVGRTLSEENARQLWIPPGFAHGFLTLSDTAHLFYKLTDYYSPEHDRSLRWDDPDIGVDWPIEGDPILSDKDAAAPYLRNAEVFA